MAGVKGRSGGTRRGSGRKLDSSVASVRDFIRHTFLSPKVKAAIRKDIETDPDKRLAYYQAAFPRPLPEAGDGGSAVVVLLDDRLGIQYRQ